MTKKLTYVGMVSCLLLAFIFVPKLEAARGFSSSSSSRSSSTISRPSSSGLYNKPSSGGYSKPSSPANSGSSGYSKPSAPPGSGSVSGGYSKPPAPPNNNATGSSGYNKPATSSPPFSPNAPTAYAKGNRFDSDTTQRLKMDKSQKSLASYEAEKSRFKTPPPAIEGAFDFPLIC